jgi:hypothetical protein
VENRAYDRTKPIRESPPNRGILDRIRKKKKQGFRFIAGLQKVQQLIQAPVRMQFANRIVRLVDQITEQSDSVANDFRVLRVKRRE